MVVLFLLYTLVVYFTNASCTLAALLRNHPLDGGKKFRGKRLLGDGKTVQGTLIGLNVGLLTAFLLGLDFRISFMVVMAALLGDLIGSFIKRRLGLERGKELPVIDQLGFIITSYLVLSFYIELEYLWVIILFAATYALHKLTNKLAYRLKLKKVPW